MKSVNIKGRKYKITWVDEIGGNSNISGRTKMILKEILLTEDSERFEETCLTIIHELLHAHLYECGLVEESVDESMVSWFHINFFSILNCFLDIVKGRYEECKDELKNVQIFLNKFIKGEVK